MCQCHACNASRGSDSYCAPHAVHLVHSRYLCNSVQSKIYTKRFAVNEIYFSKCQNWKSLLK